MTRGVVRSDSSTSSAVTDVGRATIAHLAQVVVDTLDPRASAEFWRQLLGLAYREGHEPPGAREDDPAGRDWLNLETPDGRPALAFQRVDDLARATWPGGATPQQLHLDLTVRDAEELARVYERVVALGGACLDDRSLDTDEALYVFADLDGHPFCVFVAATD